MLRMLLLLLCSAALPANAQEKTWRLGLLTPGAAESSNPGGIRDAALARLAERGFVEGRNLVFIPAAAGGNVARLPQLAEELARQGPDVIIVVGTIAARAALRAAPGTPIVLSFAGDDPVKSELAESLARPGRSITGIYFRAVENDAKRLELLSEAMPAARALGFLAAPTLEPERAELLAQTAARLGVSLTTRVVQAPDEFEAAFDAFKSAGASGVLVMGTTLFPGHTPHFVRLANERRLALACEWDFLARQGCMLGYGPDLVALRQLTGDYVARILNGAKPAETPIQQPDRFLLAVNVRAAGRLGLQLSATLLARADEVIE